MPTVVNGIGTWYYGRRRIHRRKGTCQFCRRLVELESHDTTLYFVAFFVPLIPLGQKRILDLCPTCQRHKLLPLKKWEEAKAADIARLLEKLRQDPDDRDTILSGLALAATYQDPVLLDKLADSLAKHRTDDPAIQAQLGAAYGYFARHAEAEDAYRASLAAQDDPAVRRQLAVTLLKQGRPAEARPLLRHVLDERLQQEAGMLFLLVEGYQAEGQHQEALEIMDERDAAFPNLAITKEWLAQRKTSERYLSSGKKVRSAYLSESPKAGYREGSWTAYLPRLVAPVLLLGLLAWYLGAAVWYGRERQVYLVNGTSRPYAVTVNGHEQKLAPGVPTPVRVPEGEVTVAFRDGNPPPEPIRCRVETPFFTRPFVRHTFIINPDRLALVLKEEAVYATNPVPNPPPEVHLGEALYAFDGLDYEFAPFPDSVEVSEGSTAHKTRVELAPNLTTEVRLRVAGQLLDPPHAQEYVRRLLDRDPDDVVALDYLLRQLGDDEALAFLRPRLADRPVRVEWHRAYQARVEKAHPDEDLRPTYRQLVQETGRQPDALYLLARVTDDDPAEADRLLHEAAGAKPPSAYALYALGQRALDQGQFDEGLRWAARAAEVAPGNRTIQEGHRAVLLAAGKYQPLLQEFEQQQLVPGRKVHAVEGQMLVHALQGDEAGAQALLQQAVGQLANPGDAAARDALTAQLEVVLACARRDAARYLEWVPRAPNPPAFAPALLRGDLREAAAHVSPDPDEAPVQHGLLYLAATKAGDKKLAEEQWGLLVKDLTRQRGEVRRLGQALAGGKPPDAGRVRGLLLGPAQKRVVLAAVARRYPQTAKELLPLARKLDFAPDPTSLCLRKVMD